MLILVRLKLASMLKMRLSGNVTARQSCIDVSYPTDEFHVLMVMSTPCDKVSHNRYRSLCLGKESISAWQPVSGLRGHFRFDKSSYHLIPWDKQRRTVAFRVWRRVGRLCILCWSWSVCNLPSNETCEFSDGSNNTVQVGHVNVYFLNAMNQMWEDMVEPSVKKFVEFIVIHQSTKFLQPPRLHISSYRSLIRWSHGYSHSFPTSIPAVF